MTYKKFKKFFLADNPQNDIADKRTRKPIRWLTKQEKQKLERSPLVFLKDRFKGPQHTIDPKSSKRMEQVARKLGTIARKTRNPVVFGAQFKKIENGSIRNYSPHTAWVREDGKQPRVIRHDGLAFVPDPRVYGKLRSAQLKDFVAYKHLPRAKPCVSAARVDSTKPTGSSGQLSLPAEKVTLKPSTSVSPKRNPPKNIEQIIRQIINRKALGPQRIHETAPATLKKQPQTTTQISSTSINLKSPSRRGNGSPQKVPRDNTHIEFECDTSISLSSDDFIDQNKSQSPQKPPAKRVDRKNTQPQDILPSRRPTST